jgi:conjugal transfer pilus assembly protein TraB
VKSKIKEQFIKYFIANSGDNEQNKINQKRLGLFIGVIVLTVLLPVFYGMSKKVEEQKVKLPDSQEFELQKLTDNGASYEDKWIKGAKKEVDAVKEKADTIEQQTKEITDNLDKTKISKEELKELLREQKQVIEAEFEKRILAETEKVKKEQSDRVKEDVGGHINYSGVPEKASYVFGKYIPAGSHAKAVLISGVDAGIGITSEADPRHVLMRVTGTVTSAGFGVDNLKSDVLIGCIIQGQAVGDISSEKAYVKPTVMTCAKKPNTVIEIPVKGYIISQGKSGIRGKVISREGDLVLKSFLSGAISGLGGGVSQSMRPKYEMTSGSLVGEKQSLKDILGGGMASGVGSSSDRLSDYFIKKAEQYQPVISIDEGTIVDIVFQEGFSIEEVKNEKK